MQRQLRICNNPSGEGEKNDLKYPFDPALRVKVYLLPEDRG